jgi:hypothetical protein
MKKLSNKKKNLHVHLEKKNTKIINQNYKKKTYTTSNFAKFQNNYCLFAIYCSQIEQFFFLKFGVIFFFGQLLF